MYGIRQEEEERLGVSIEAARKGVELAIQQIEKQFGKGSIMYLGQQMARLNIQVIPTGNLAIDAALGVGGLPRGRIIEIYGPESSGKTTVALHVIAEAQKTGGVAAFVDAEHALSPDWARSIGVDIDNLLISQPDTGEQALEITETLVRSGAVDIIVVDSVAALVPKAELEGEMGDNFVGVQARLMSQALRKLAGAISKSRCIVIFINQLRDKIGVLFGNPETQPGGRALKFYSSVRIEVRRSDTIKDGQDVIGARTKVKVVKNKVAPPFKQCEVDILYGEGVSRVATILDLGVTHGLFTKNGTWFTYRDQKIGQGREAAMEWLRNHPDEARAVEAALRERLFQGAAPADADRNVGATETAE